MTMMGKESALCETAPLNCTGKSGVANMIRSHLLTVLNVGKSKLLKVRDLIQIVIKSKNLVLFHLTFRQLTLILLLYLSVQMIVVLL